MTDLLRPNPLGLPLDPDPRLPPSDPEPRGDAPKGAIDDPVVWPVDRPEDPDDRSLDLPGETSGTLDADGGEPG